MEEIKVGEYIRIKDGYICKATEWWVNEYNKEPETYTEIEKHSFNIIDLVEVGDIVRIQFPPDEYCNEPVEVIWTIKGSAMLNNLKCEIKSKEVKLKSIVTKERFKNAECKIDN